jgi:hypothetical protein
MPRLLPWKLVSRTIGLLLLVAAFLKAQGLGVETVASVGVFSAAELQVVVVELEIFLGIWLLSLKKPAGAWIASLLTFGVFAGTSLYLGLLGQSSCGCFGQLSVNPWLALGFDAIVLLGFLLGRPPLNDLWYTPATRILRTGISILSALVAIAAFTGLLFGLAYLGYGSVPAAIANLRGERISVQPRLVNVGEGNPDDIQVVRMSVANWKPKPIRLVGTSQDCSSFVDELPLTIPSHQSRTFGLKFRFSGSPGIFTHRVTFLLDDDGLRLLGFRVTGRVLPTMKTVSMKGD